MSSPARVVAAVSFVLSLSAQGADAPQPSSPEQSLEPFVTHPVVAGFERFYAASGNEAPTDLVPGGRVLLGDLGCVACHKVEGAASQAVTPKQAPVLDGVGSRVRLAFIRELLANPQKAKPGTTMPDLLAGLPEAERTDTVEALVHFLATTGGIAQCMSELSAIKAGEQHFHRFGCVACHAPRKHAGPLPKSSQPQLDDEDDPRLKVPTTQTLVPLGDLTAKYSLPSLAKFLQDPLSVRPSGRMPGLGLQEKEAREIAAYFFKDHKVPPNLNYAYFEGDWQELPDFDAIKPNATGSVSGFDLAVTKRPNNFAIRFTGFVHIAKPGQYQFWLGSDDGSRLAIDDQIVVDLNGVHAHTEKEGRLSLDFGPHPITVDYFQGGGEWTLSLEYQGQGVKRQSLAGAVTLEREPPPPQPTDGGKVFEPNAELAAKGRQFFANIGCAACHKLKDDGQEIASEFKPKPLAKMQASGGCLSTDPQRGLPHYRLTQLQRLALSAAMTAVAKTTEPLGPAELIAHSLTTFNCYACHVRDKIGGVEQVRNAFFETPIPEMGDEGRIPPALDGVGDKLRENYLQNLLSNGAKDRPYMHARMPKFNLGHLAKAFVTLDQKTAADLPKLDERLSRVKTSGRQLVGEKGLSCVKCHPFNEHQATGIQAINLTSMTKRLREDWFYRYMANPQDYRPGTRMPAPWPFGQATIKDVLDGDASKQMRSVWTYLTDGTKAAIPAGIVREAIVLVPDNEPIIYRNFLEGLTPRGLAVGYPQGANLAFDVDRFALALIWQGAFIDASKHWAGRGSGNQSPLGDNVLSLPTEIPFAALTDANQAWPNQPAKEQGYRFKGYRFDEARRPILQYQFGRVAIEDHLVPTKSGKEASLDRKLSLAVTPGDPIKLDNLFYRAGSGCKIETDNNGWFTVDSSLKVHLQSPAGSSAVIRQNGNRIELLVPVNLKSGSTEISQTYSW